ncbi:hypothetical protein [Paenibacillus contaminans]|uniref:NodB homology domain-containing protein n=1 Tax=Paenibacillus contaminans TaxID=450362 RepID=A0A329LJU3_9BACL|nr:hypothetical protein [Paenibacillus contaminans]RAV08039.1 hypothetical protein DQG23_41450 [Paenibacillus contaminans]
MRIAKVAVYVDRQAAERHWHYGLNVFQTYIYEILEHAGIAYEKVDRADRLDGSAYDVVIASLTNEDAAGSQALWDAAAAGSTVIAYGGLSALAGKIHAIQLPASSAGYALLPEAIGETRPLRFTAAQPWGVAPEAGQVRQEGTVRLHHPEGKDIAPLLLVFPIEKGELHRFAVDIPTTVVHLQQGMSPVLFDGVPAPDGSAPLNEGILKADDRISLDWELDRIHSETGQPYFPHPYADLWREALVSHLLRTVTDKGMTLPFVGYWPDGVQHVALISHDSDGNIDESAETTLRVLKEQDIRSSWCMIEPGYSPEVYDKILGDGHELAFHYNALTTDKGFWDEAEFKRQFGWLKEATKLDRIVSNKDHYTIFHGWGDLFAWCESVGIQVDQTRGPSKRGNVGYLFGTCHPYMPIAWANERNRMYDVMEIGFLTQDLDIDRWADSSVIVPFLEQAARVEGIAHFLFHQVHLHTKESVRKAFARFVQEAKSRGFVFWTAEEINAWERSRRQVRIQTSGEGVDVQVALTLQAGAEAASASEASGKADGIPAKTVVWIPLPAGQASPESVLKFGVPCLKKVVS